MLHDELAEFFPKLLWDRTVGYRMEIREASFTFFFSHYIWSLSFQENEYPSVSRNMNYVLSSTYS